jgi:hypothetical protein
MNTTNAFSFFIFGLTLALLPAVAPGGFPLNGLDGTSARALWLEIVGSAQVAIGAVWLGQTAISRFADRLVTIEMSLLDRSRLATGDFRKQVIKV